MMMDPWQMQESFRNRDVDAFAQTILGIKPHPGQRKWLNKSWKLVNVLDPSNQWGKTLAVAIKHIYHAVVKPQLFNRVNDWETWQKIAYRTLNVGKTYEVARGVFEAMREIIEGEVLLPDGTNNRSLLKGWAVIKYHDVSNQPPSVKWWNGTETLIRSYDDLGSSFKRMKLAYVSSDECGDIPELELFLNGTLLPRVTFWMGQIDLIGTHQPKGEEYKKISDMARVNYESFGDQADYYHQTGNLYENDYMDKAFIQSLENIADPRLREQIIYGKYVDMKDHFFTYEEIDKMFVDMPYDYETGYSEQIDPEGFYVLSIDLAATEDETAGTCIRYNEVIWSDILRKNVEMPYKVVFHKGFQGKRIPISMQYELIKSWYMDMKNICKNVAFVFDAGSLGGKNAQDAFKELYGHPFPPLHKSYAQEKAYAIGSVKEVLGRGRKLVKADEDHYTDLNPRWGWLKASRHLKELRRQFEVYALDDKSLKQDRIATVWQAIHFIEKRRPKVSHNRAVDMDILSSTIPGARG